LHPLEKRRLFTAHAQERTHAPQQMPQTGCNFSLNNFISERQKVRWQLDACSLCGLEIDNKRVACRLLERQVGGPSATQDARGQTGGALKAFPLIRPL
jgi:hypothetical protein